MECHGCDKLTHVKCVNYGYDEENFECIECKPAVYEETNSVREVYESTRTEGQTLDPEISTDQEEIARHDAIGQEAYLVDSSSVLEGTLVQLSVQELPTIENFLLSIGMDLSKYLKKK